MLTTNREGVATMTTRARQRNRPGLSAADNDARPKRDLPVEQARDRADLEAMRDILTNPITSTFGRLRRDRRAQARDRETTTAARRRGRVCSDSV
jgi:hypothetical protein